jgi:hypothetical protein
MLFKFVMPAFGIFMMVLLSTSTGPRLWLIFPSALVVFYSSAADLKISNKLLSYRRFIAFKRMPSDITDARWSLFPGLAYIKFRHFLPPWGRLYYVVEEKGAWRSPFGRSRFMESLVTGEYIKSEESSHNNALHKMRRFQIRWVFISAICMGVGALMPVFEPHWAPSSSPVYYVWKITHEPIALICWFALAAFFLIREKAQGLSGVVLGFIMGGTLAALLRIV